MGKKRCRSKHVSKGERNSTAKSVTKLVRQSRSPIDVELNKLKAWRRGHNPWLVYPNPVAHTNRPMLRIRANDYLGDPRRTYGIYSGGQQ